MERISFIPKTEIKTIYKNKGPGLLVVISALLLFLSLTVFGGLLFYKNSLKNKVEELGDSLNKARSAFDQPFIEDLKTLSQKIDVAKVLVNSHQSVSNVFVLLGDVILETVRLSYFESGDKKEVLLDGVTGSYSLLAKQIETLKANKNITNLEVSNLNLTETGNISFSVRVDLNTELFTFSEN